MFKSEQIFFTAKWCADEALLALQHILSYQHNYKSLYKKNSEIAYK